MKSRLKQWLVVVALTTSFVFIGLVRFHVKNVSLSLMFLLPYCFLFVLLLYVFAREEILAKADKRN